MLRRRRDGRLGEGDSGRPEPGLRIDLEIGLAMARPLDTATAVLERADAAMYAAKPRDRRPVARARRAGRSVAVAVGPDAEMLHDLHGQLGKMGVLVIPVRTLEIAKLLIALVDPAIFAVADGSASDAWLEQLGVGYPNLRRLRIVAAGGLVDGRLSDPSRAAVGARPDLDFVRRHLGAWARAFSRRHSLPEAGDDRRRIAW